MYDLGRVTGYIRINATDALAAYGKTRAAHASTMSALERSAMTTKRIGLAFATVGGAAIAGFGLAVKASADFEKRLSFVQALTKATPDQMNTLRESMFKLGQQFGISSNEVADAYVELGKAGASIEQIAGGMGRATVTLARSADISAADAAKNIVGISATFEKGAKAAVHVANLLQGSANAAIIDVDDVAYAMKYAGSTAHTMGIQLGDLTDVVTILGQANIRGSQAGTSLRRMMIQMTGPTQTAHAALQALGIITKDGTNQFFKANGELRPFQQNMAILRKALIHLKPEQRTQALNTIFGSRAIAAANVLLKTSNKEWGRFHGEIRKGTAEGIAKKRLDNLAGAWDKFKAAMDVALIRAGGPAQRPLMQLVNLLTRLVKAFGKLDPGTQQTIVRMVLLTGVIFTLAGAFMLLSSFVFRLVQTFIMWKEMMTALKSIRLVQTIIVNLRAAVWLLNRALLALVVENPVGAIIVGLVALGIALYELYKHWAPFRNLVNSIGRALVWFGKTVIGALKTAFDWIKSHGALIAAAIMVAFAPFSIVAAIVVGVIYEIIHHWRGLWTAIKAVGKAIAVAFKATWKAVSYVTKKVWDIIGPFVMFYIHMWISKFKFLWSLVKTGFKVMWDIVKGVTILGWHVIKNVFMLIWHLISGVVKLVAAILDGQWRKAWSIAWHLVWNAIKDIGKILWDFSKDALKLLYNAGKDLIKGLINGIVSMGKDAVGSVIGLGKGIVHGVTSFFGIGSPSRLMAKLGAALPDGLAMGISNSGDHAVNAMLNVVRRVWNAVAPKLHQMAHAINSFLNWGSSTPYQGSAGAAEYTQLVGQRRQFLNDMKKKKKQGGGQFHMPKIDLGGADPGADFSDLTGSSGGGSKKKGAKQKRVDLTLLFQSGQWIMDGFKKGMQAGAKGVRSFLKDLQHRIKSYWNKAKSYGDKKGMQELEKFGKQVDRYGQHLLRIAQKRDAFLKKIEKQQKHLDDLLKAKHDYAKQVADSIRQLADVTQVVTIQDASGNPDVTSDNIVSGLQNTLMSVKEYYDELAKLHKMGLNDKTYKQLVAAGPQEGGPYVRALLDGGKETVSQVNSLTKQINDEAKKVGAQTSSTMYNQGIETAKGFIKGWRSHASKLYQAMRDVAKELVRTLKKELGIKSPSVVMQGLGRFTTRGYAMGILAEAKRVREAAKTLGLAAQPKAESLSLRAAGVSPASLRVSATLPDDYKGRDVEVNQYIKSTEPKKAADESARKIRTAAKMGVFD